MMNAMSPSGTTSRRPELHAELQYVRQKWGWFALLGVTMLVAGMVALICTVTTTLVTVFFLGWVLLISGGVQLVEVFGVRSWSGFFVHLLTGILQIVVGLLLITSPGENAVTITLIFAIFLLVGGLFRMIAGFRLPVVGGVVALSGAVSFILGMMIWRQWPSSGLWFIGTFVGIDLIFHGISWLAFALRARRVSHEQSALPA